MRLQIRQIRIYEKVTESIGFEIRHIMPHTIACMHKLADVILCVIVMCTIVFMY